ncbi:MAG: nucleotidyltransferase domain-containing protein [Nitrospirae bacterium]|nr:nucleotidyltransferase domain-containing protein [Nitrospirota bacterium]
MAIRKLIAVPEDMRKRMVDCLRRVMLNHDNILFAFIYGSFAGSEAVERYGDVDVAIYSSDLNGEGKSYILNARLEEEIVEEFSMSNLNLLPVEVINLKEAPYHFLVSLLRQPYLMIKENEDALTSLIEETSGRALANIHLRKESIREVLEADICRI